MEKIYNQNSFILHLILVCSFQFGGKPVPAQSLIPSFLEKPDTTELHLNNAIYRPSFPKLLASISGKVRFKVNFCADAEGRVTEAKIVEEEQGGSYVPKTKTDEKRDIVHGWLEPSTPVEIPLAMRDSVLAFVKRIRFQPATVPRRCGEDYVGTLKHHPGILWNFAHSDNIGSMLYSPDGTILATTAGNDGRIYGWDTQKRQLSFLLKSAGQGSAVFRFSPDGKQLAALYADGKFRIWNIGLGHGYVMKELALEPIAVWQIDMKYSPDGKWVALPQDENTILLVDAKLNEIARTISCENKDYRRGMDFSPDGKRLLLNQSGDLQVVDISNGQTLLKLEYRSRLDTREVGFFSPDGKTIYTATGSGFVEKYDAATGDSIGGYQLPGRHNIRYIREMGDRQRISVSGVHEAVIEIFNIEDGSHLAKYDIKDEEHVFSYALHPNGNQITIGCENNGIRFVDAATGGTLSVVDGGDFGVNDLAFSPNGKLLAVAAKDGSVALWRSDSFLLERIIPAHSQWVTALCFSPDGSMLATAGRDSTAKVWDTATGSLLETISTHKDAVNCVAFAHDGMCLATGGQDRTVWLHSLGDEGPRSRLLDKDNKQGIYGLAFSPDGSCLVASSIMGKAKIWNLKKRSRPYTMLENVGWSKVVAFSDDSRHLLIGCDQKVVVFDMASRAPIDTISLHQSIVQDALFADVKGKRFIMSVGLDDRLASHKLGGYGDLAALFDFHSGGTTSLALSPGQRWVATGGWDNKVRIFDNSDPQPWPLWTLIGLGKISKWAALNRDGSFICNEKAKGDFFYMK